MFYQLFRSFASPFYTRLVGSLNLFPFVAFPTMPRNICQTIVLFYRRNMANGPRLGCNSSRSTGRIQFPESEREPEYSNWFYNSPAFRHFNTARGNRGIAGRRRIADTGRNGRRNRRCRRVPFRGHAGNVSSLVWFYECRSVSIERSVFNYQSENHRVRSQRRRVLEDGKPRRYVGKSNGCVDRVESVQVNWARTDDDY